MNLNKTFIDSYLTFDGRSDNYVFENCPQEFLDFAFNKFNSEKREGKVCAIKWRVQDETILQAVLDKCGNVYEEKLLTQDYIYARIMQGVYSVRNSEEFSKICKHLGAFYSGDMWEIKGLHKESVMFPLDLINAVKKYGKFDLCIFFEDIKNFEMQRTFNNLLSSRLPLSVKFFSGKRLISGIDSSGIMIQNPHDYMSVDVNKFIQKEEQVEV